ncbi:hypothetical protein AK830_g8159 [Neonectria ditissima]|uniref:DUF7924 domain-containing protein n=1 Tax=Neonectria ditissima TaxID=78410 RepID=A0A0N8H6A2_9HYPO|nr:hypothetical protein AK830_g8159 [Neonectria ditissima]
MYTTSSLSTIRAAMARTRAAHSGRTSSASEDQGKWPEGIRKRRSTRSTTHLQPRQAPKPTERDQSHSSLNKKTLSRQGSATPGKRGTKRPVDALDRDLDSPQKRPRRSPRLSLLENTSDRSATNSSTHDPIDPIGFWAREGRWPKGYFELNMEHLLARKRSRSSLIRKRSNSATSTTPSDQKPRDEKSAPYRDPRYETLLGTRGSFMVKSNLDVTTASKGLSRTLIEATQTLPRNSLFHDDVFESTCQKIHNRNEARVIQDITRLIVPSAESLATFGAKHLDILTESVNEGWNNSIPLTGTRPQPDYSVGFTREAFTDDQLAKLSPYLGDFLTGDQSFFMGTYYMYFPFLTCEVKCGAAGLDVADRQNAHSMTLAVRAVAELFRAVKRSDEVHRQILAFSVSHDHRSVRIYGHYPVVDGDSIKYYRHPIHTYDFTALDGKEKWTAYRFTKNVYDTWMPAHFKNICSAIDQLPDNLDLDVPSLVGTGLSRDLESHHLSQADAGAMSLPVAQEDRSGDTVQESGTPGTSFTDPTATKRRKGRKE